MLYYCIARLQPVAGLIYYGRPPTPMGRSLYFLPCSFFYLLLFFFA